MDFCKFVPSSFGRGAGGEGLGGMRKQDRALLVFLPSSRSFPEEEGTDKMLFVKVQLEKTTGRLLAQFAASSIICNEPGANWIRPGSLKCQWRVVVGQQATKKADHLFKCRV
jgi:hypothetical protein